MSPNPEKYNLSLTASSSLPIMYNIFLLFNIIMFLSLSTMPCVLANDEKELMEGGFREFLAERKRSYGANSHLFGDGFQLNETLCKVPLDIQKEIAAYKPVVNMLLESILAGKYKGDIFKVLDGFVKQFPHRVHGSVQMERSVDYLRDWMKQLQMSNVREEEAKVKSFKRGVEYAAVISPMYTPLSLRTMANSVETPLVGIKALVIVVRSYAEMKARAKEIKGKILVFSSYDGDAHSQILFGATAGSKVGALAVLCRSPVRLLYSSMVSYTAGVAKIPAAIISPEHADMLDNMVRREPLVTMYLRLVNHRSPDYISRNLLADYVGRERPNEYVMMMSHPESWDAGEGVQDNALGIIMQLEVIKILTDLNLRPRRTIRNALFAAEEYGILGAVEWVKKHKAELGQYSATLEADVGCVRASGLIISGSNSAACIVNEVMHLFVNETKARSISVMTKLPSNMMATNEEGVPNISVNGDDEQSTYWEVQHTDVDTMASVKTDELDKCLAILAATTFVVADMQNQLPRT